MVDDDEFVRDVCSQVLTEAGYGVETAANGIEALESLSGSVYDLVISDMDMPRLDGISLYFCALRDHPYLKDRFLFMTGNPSQEAQSVLSGLNKIYLLKPFNVADFLRHVDMFMV